ncbi:MAG: alpha/beta fold hydrolase [Elusimicrobia bacterium]|nr:alpha/beta fold hydrolase [Elusimicrobiota bacterium]
MILQTAVLLAATAFAGSAAVPAKPLILPGQDVELKSEDGWTLAGKYLPSSSAPQTMILLHGKGERKELWIKLAKALAAAGYGYFGLDLRGHGESAVGPDGLPASWRKFKALPQGKGPNDFEDMTRDIAAVVSWLGTQGVPEETVGVIGTDVGGSVGLKYAAVHPKVPLVVLLSPGTHYEEVLTPNAMRFYKNRPVLMIYSEADRFASRDAPVLYAFARMAAGEKNATLVTGPKLPGTRLPQSTAVIRQIVSWLQNPVKPELPAGSTGPVTGQALSTGTADDSLSPDEAPLPLPPEQPALQDPDRRQN